MHRNEFLCGPRAERVNGVCGEFLSGPRLSLNEHRGPGGSDLLDRLKHLDHRRRVPYHALQARTAADLLAKFDIFTPHVALTQSTLDEHLKPVNVHRLCHEIVCASLHCLNSRIHGTIGRHHDANGRFRQLQRLFHQIHPILGAQAQIGNQNISGIGLQRRESARNIARHVNLVMILQSIPKTIASVLLVVDDQEGL